MKIIEPKVERIIIDDPIDKIETIARVCTQSKNKNKRKKGELLKQCLKLKHYSILEHFRILITFKDKYLSNELIIKIRNTHPFITKYMDITTNDENFSKISCDLRKIYELFLMVFNRDFPTFHLDDVDLFCYMLYIELKKHHDIFSLMFDTINITPRMTYCKQILEFRNGLNTDTIDSNNLLFLKIDKVIPKPFCHTVKVTTSRGVCMQLLRHRALSYMMESTRYCKYTEGITVVKPTPYQWTIDENDIYKTWIKNMQSIENMYLKLLNMTNSAQEASGVLPKDLKADLYITGTEEAFCDMLNKRLHDNADPKCKYICQEIYNKIHNYTGE